MQAKAAMPPWLHAANEGADCLIDVALAGAEEGRHAGRAPRLVGEGQGRLLVQLGVGIHDDNEALARYFAERLGVPTARVSVIGGVTSARKTVRFAGIGQRQALLALAL